MKIRIIVTGGTFDKEYNELNGELFFRKTHLPEMLQLGRCKLNLEVAELMMIDSLQMTDKDRRVILAACVKSKEDRIVITHGTDTMVETAKLLGRSLADKTVVITGAMVPYKFGSSDGLFNLGSALAFAQTLPYGVYIAMNGKLFHSENVRKNRSKGEFEPVSSGALPAPETPAKTHKTQKSRG
jgi:L-asparaginase